MPIKGFDKFRQKLPALSGNKILILPILILCVIAVAFAIFITFDTLPATLASSGVNAILLSFFPLFGILLVGGIGFLLVWQIWLWRDSLRARYGPTSYQRALPFGLAGVVLIMTVAINQYLPYYSFAPGFWAASSLQFIAIPLENYLGAASSAIFFLKDILGAVFFVMGLLMCVRAIQVFGVDYMTVVYLYFPEESRIQRSKIYSVLRHPTYAGLLTIGLGGTLITFTLLSFVAFFIFLTGFYIHIHFVEERELIQRFGNSYREYRRKVPAFFVAPNNIGTLFKFLFKRGTDNEKVQGLGD
jgi:protein-S-isoprenylcysteine O-methyltransferase Ste14